jgi:hypothetical protein
MKFTTLLKNFRKELDEIAIKNNGALKQANLSLFVCSRYFQKLRDWVMEFPFVSQQDEIYFFKHIKPKVASELIFFRRIKSLELELPETGVGRQKKN